MGILNKVAPCETDYSMALQEETDETRIPDLQCPKKNLAVYALYTTRPRWSDDDSGVGYVGRAKKLRQRN